MFVMNNNDGTFTVSFEKSLSNYLIDENGKVEILEKTFLTQCTDDSMYKKNTNTIAYDELSNRIIIPSGFKVLIDDTTQFIDKASPKIFEGIVIQDEIGNEFVYIPCGNVKTNDSNFTISLNRYTFDQNTGKSSEINDSIIDDLYKESDDMSHSNINNISSFKNSVALFGGFYIARYEASYGGEISVEGEKLQVPQSKKSTSTRNSGVNLEIGMLWNNIPQNTADLVCSNMYKGNQFVSANTSLVNSYAWDTTLTFIQQNCGEYYVIDKTIGNINTNYNISNTGETTDIACNIYNIADNICEFTTECYLEANSNKSVRRGRILCK